MSGTLDGQVLVITGGGSGIGRATAVAASEAGASVVLLGRTLDKLEAVSGDIEQRGGRALAIRADVGHGDDVQKAFEQIVGELGHVDVLLNNAGTEGFGFIDEIDEAKWDDRQATNLKSYFLTAKAALDVGGMKQRRSGLIINTASTNIRASYPGMAMHVAFKHGALGFTESLQKEVAKFGIRVTLLCPGQVATEWALNDPVKSTSQRIHPSPQYIEPEDVARVTLFLSSQPAHVNFAEVRFFHTERVQ